MLFRCTGHERRRRLQTCRSGWRGWRGRRGRLGARQGSSWCRPPRPPPFRPGTSSRCGPGCPRQEFGPRPARPPAAPPFAPALSLTQPPPTGRAPRVRLRQGSDRRLARPRGSRPAPPAPPSPRTCRVLSSRSSLPSRNSTGDCINGLSRLRRVTNYELQQ